MNQEYQNINATGLKDFMEKHRDDQYVLIDVRQPREYVQSHIPGAILIPLGELPARISELPLNKDIIFYCHSGKRSVAAAVFSGSRPYQEGQLYNLQGGMLDWQGRTLTNMPNLKVFTYQGTEEELLYQAMNLEKGAHRFYLQVEERFKDEAFSPAIDILAKAEVGHANMIYSFWEKTQDDPPGFETLYDSLPGDILEGGMSFSMLIERLDKVSDMPCTEIIEMAIQIEFSAYDLYRVMGQRYKGMPLEKTFIILCQAEKEHMRIASEALIYCL